VASDPESGSFTLWRLAVRSWLSPRLAHALAANPLLPKPLLLCLAARRWDVKAEVARNPRCPRRLHRSMAWSSDWAVRAGVASSAAATAGILADLIAGSDARVRLYVAANPSLPSDLAGRLLQDPNPFVRRVAAAHPAAPAAGLRQLADGMTAPAWTLRAIAANPSCPADLTDQLLTWIALGGAGHADPLFDPVECTGHPGDTRFTQTAWYLKYAGTSTSEQHALWRVRAAVMRATHSIPGQRARALARDCRPEVRRTIAGAYKLPLSIRLEMRRDADPGVAALASRAFAARKGAEIRRALRPIALRALFPVLVVLVLVFMIAESRLPQEARS
jgi:hypothetical protein